MSEEIVPPIPENAPLPTMLALYKRDLHYAARLLTEQQVAYLCTFPPEHKQAFYESCLWLVVSIACNACLHKYERSYWTYIMDMIQVGNMALLRAIERASERAQGFTEIGQFYAYASKFIKGDIYRSYVFTANIYIPPASRRKLNLEAKERLMALEEHVSLETLRDVYDFDIEETKRDITDELGTFEKREKLEALFPLLPTKEQKVLRLYYGLDGEPLNFHEIGRIMGRTHDHVGRLYNQALARMAGQGKKPAMELYLQDRERRFHELLAEWRAQGIKVTIHKFAFATQTGTRTAADFLREQGAIRPRSRYPLSLNKKGVDMETFTH